MQIIHAADQDNLQSFQHPENKVQSPLCTSLCYSWIIKKPVHLVVLVIFLPAISVTEGNAMPTQNHVVQKFHSLRQGTGVPGAVHPVMALPAPPSLLFPLLLGSKTLSSPFSFPFTSPTLALTLQMLQLCSATDGKAKQPRPGFTALLERRPGRGKRRGWVAARAETASSEQGEERS